MSNFYRRCPHCGRQWSVSGQASRNLDGKGGWTGFLDSPTERHINRCAKLTPAQRLAANRRDEKRWVKHPPRTRIWNNPDHPGLKDTPQ